MTTPTKHTAGSYVDSACWGEASNRRVALLALANGWQPDGYIGEYLSNPKYAAELEVSPTESDFWLDAAEEAEKWLNEHASEENHCWGWHEGNFRYQSLDWWWEKDGTLD